MPKKEYKKKAYCARCLEPCPDKNYLNGKVYNETGIHLFYCSERCLGRAIRKSRKEEIGKIKRDKKREDWSKRIYSYSKLTADWSSLTDRELEKLKEWIVACYQENADW